MKKGLTYAALAAMSLTAVAVAPTPSASAATSQEDGFYNFENGKYISVSEFVKLKVSEKIEWIKGKKVALVLGGKAIAASAIATHTEEELEKGYSTIEEYQTKNKVDFNDFSTDVDVVSVSAINKQGVTIKFPALKEAKTDVTVEVKDNKGNVVEVKPVSVLDVGETTATFTFKTALTAEPVGTWTVNKVSFDANAQAAVIAVKDAKNQVELLTALNSSYFTGVNADLIAEYFSDADRASVVTTEDVQKVINKVNKAETGKDSAKAVKEAKNQVELLKALQDGGFDRVNADLIKEYFDANRSAVVVPSDVQTIIDTINLNAAKVAVEAASGLDKTSGAVLSPVPATALTADVLSKAQALVSALPEKEVSEKETKKGLQDRLDKANAVVKVKDATTQASLLSALKSPVLKLKDIDDSLAKYYKSVLDNTEKANIKTAAYTAQTIVSNGKVAAIAATVEKVGEITDKTSTADLKALLTELKRLNASEFTEDIIDALLEDYKTEILDAIEVAAPADTDAINTIIEGANDPANAIDDVTGASDSTDLLDALKAKTLNLNNVKDANKDSYYDAAINTNGVSYFTKVTTPAEAQKTVNAVNAFVDANNATSAAQLNSALNSFVAIISDDFFAVTEASNYIDLSSAAKLEVAEIVLNAKEAEYEDAMELAVAINDAVTAYKAFFEGTDGVGGVNNADSISAMNTALNKDELPAFQGLSAAVKVEKAEAVYNKLVELKAAEKGPKKFTTIAEVKAAAGL